VTVPLDSGKIVTVPLDSGKTLTVPMDNGKTVTVPLDSSRTSRHNSKKAAKTSQTQKRTLIVVSGM
jgi:hypothetical protein